MRKFHTILLGCGVVFLVYLLWTVGVGELWRQLASLGWGLIPLMLGEGVAEMIHTVGWRYCLSGPLRSLPWITLFRIRMAGYALNYVTPTAALGGEVTKGVLLAEHHNGPEAASGVLIGKLCFALAHLVFVALGALLVVWQVHLPGAVLVAMLCCGGLLAAGIITFLLLQKYGKLGGIVRWMAAGKPVDHPLQKAAQSVTTVDEAMTRFYQERPRDLLLAMGWHLVGYSVGIAQTWLFFRLLHFDTPLIVAAGAWFLGMWFDLLTFAVPLNLGTLEGTRILAFQAIGYSSVAGMTYGLAFRLAQIFWTCFGLASHALLASRAAPRSPDKGIPLDTSPVPASEPTWNGHSPASGISARDPEGMPAHSCRKRELAAAQAPPADNLSTPA